MSQIDQENLESSDEQITQKLTDVSEAIRYRKRAQAAEQKQAALAQELSQTKAELEKLAENLSEAALEKELLHKLAAAGAKDLEAAVIIAKAKIAADEKLSAKEAAELLKKEKQYLFAKEESSGLAPSKTSGIKNYFTPAAAAVGRSAQKAADSGSRADLQEYLRARRKFI